jgi:NhaP-type Na+/H+ or K+/H+ antiporter
LGILSSAGVSHRDTLYTLVFGESLLNDGVSIVLFDSLVRHMGSEKVVDKATVHDTLWHFTIVTVGSILIGLLCGSLATLYFWMLHKMHSAVTEVGLFFAWAFIPYYMADGAGLSGIISIMVMGFVMDYYIVGGHMSEEGEWMEYIAMSSTHDEHGIHHSNHHPVEPYMERIARTCRKAFSGRGLLLSKSRHHVGFVAEVISSLMETAIFAYLGLFLFNDRVWDFGATLAGLFACVSSRAVMVLVLSLIVNACIWMDVEALLVRLWRSFRSASRVSRYTTSGIGSSLRDDDSIDSDTKLYLDVKTQLILFSAGVRGAVSYALVQNIPVYDSVTETGSHYKAQLRSMTSCAIVILMFSLGALTYFSVKSDASTNSGRRTEQTRRLLSFGLTSEPGTPNGDDESEYDHTASVEQFEIDGRHTSSSLGHARGRR